jgi:acyl carrier protein
VLVREDVLGDQRLITYLVPAQEPVPTPGALQSFLKKTLPDYMVPSAFVRLGTLPLTPNGKVDRRALPAPNQSGPGIEDAFVAHRIPVEKALAEIWADVLGLRQVGIHDNFFELGGHSLLATRVMSRIHRAFRVELPLATLFEAPTVAELAQAIIANEAKPGQTEKIAHILQRIEGMSTEDVTNMLQKKRAGQGERP